VDGGGKNRRARDLVVKGEKKLIKSAIILAAHGSLAGLRDFRVRCLGDVRVIRCLGEIGGN
jgi:hypothetical protein